MLRRYRKRTRHKTKRKAAPDTRNSSSAFLRGVRLHCGKWFSPLLEKMWRWRRTPGREEDIVDPDIITAQDEV